MKAMQNRIRVAAKQRNATQSQNLLVCMRGLWKLYERLTIQLAGRKALLPSRGWLEKLLFRKWLEIEAAFHCWAIFVVFVHLMKIVIAIAFPLDSLI